MVSSLNPVAQITYAYPIKFVTVAIINCMNLFLIEVPCVLFRLLKSQSFLKEIHGVLAEITIFYLFLKFLCLFLVGQHSKRCFHHLPGKTAGIGGQCAEEVAGLAEWPQVIAGGNGIDGLFIAGWWFGTFFIFPYFWNNHPNWLIFFRGVETSNQIGFHTVWRCFVRTSNAHQIANRVLESEYCGARHGPGGDLGVSWWSLSQH